MAKYEFEIRHKPGTSDHTADYLSRVDAQLVHEPSRMLREEVEEYPAHDEIVAVIDVTGNGGQFEEGLEQVRSYLTTVSLARINKKYRRQTKAYVVLHGVLLRRQEKSLLFV